MKAEDLPVLNGADEWYVFELENNTATAKKITSAKPTYNKKTVIDGKTTRIELGKNHIYLLSGVTFTNGSCCGISAKKIGSVLLVETNEKLI
jgi:hypothetical protein